MGHLFAILSPKLTLLEFAPGDRQQQIAGAVTVAAPNGRSNVLDHIVWGLTPRVGFSWDVNGSGRTALRGGVGMFADQPPYLHITDATSGNLPYSLFPFHQCAPGRSDARLPALRSADGLYPGLSYRGYVQRHV